MSGGFWSLPKTIRGAIGGHVIVGGPLALFALVMLFTAPGSDVGYSLLLLIASILILVAAYGLWKGKQWGRVISIVFHVLLIPFFPLGTYLGFRYGIGLIASSEVREFFEASGEQPTGDFG